MLTNAKSLIQSILFFIFFTISLVKATQAQGEFELYGRVPDDLNGQKIVLLIRKSTLTGQTEWSDTTLIKSNKFYFKGDLSSKATNATLYLIGSKLSGHKYLVLENGKMEYVSTNTYSKIFSKNKLKTGKVVGGEANVLLESLEKIIDNYYLNFGTVQKSGFIDLTIEKKHELLAKELKIISSYPGEFYSLLELDKLLFGTKDVESVRECFDLLNPELKNDPIGKLLKAKIDGKKALQKGAMLPVFQLNDSSGASFGSEKLSGKYAIIAFGATWCGPCKQNLPKLKAIYNANSGKNLNLVYINLSEEAGLWKKQIVNYGMNWINLNEDMPFNKSSISVKFGVTSVPFYIMVDPSGKIIYNSRADKDVDLKLLTEKVNAL